MCYEVGSLHTLRVTYTVLSVTEHHLQQRYLNNPSSLFMMWRFIWPRSLLFSVNDLFFSLSSPLFLRQTLQNFKETLQFIFSSFLSSLVFFIFFTLLFILFGIIYKIGFLSISPPLIYKIVIFPSFFSPLVCSYSFHSINFYLLYLR
jgi:hypothetical protein